MSEKIKTEFLLLEPLLVKLFDKVLPLKFRFKDKLTSINELFFDFGYRNSKFKTSASSRSMRPFYA